MPKFFRKVAPVRERPPRQPDYTFFGQAVLAWRETHGLSQAAVHQNGGPSDTTQSAIEAGAWRSARPHKTLVKVDDGFGWPGGTATRILYDGYDPIADPPALRMSPEPGGTHVESRSDDADSLLYRRPDDISDSEWERLKAETRDYLEYLIDKAARER